MPVSENLRKSSAPMVSLREQSHSFQNMLPLIREFVCITPPSPRKLEAEALAAHLRKAGAAATACATIPEGVRTAMEKAGDDGVVLCFGSLYSIADIRAGLEEITK